MPDAKIMKTNQGRRDIKVCENTYNTMEEEQEKIVAKYIIEAAKIY